MRRILAVLAFAGLACPALAQQSISVSLDEAQTLTFPAGIAAISVGNPAKAERLLGWRAERRMAEVVAGLAEAEMTRRAQRTDGHAQ